VKTKINIKNSGIVLCGSIEDRENKNKKEASNNGAPRHIKR